MDLTGQNFNASCKDSKVIDVIDFQIIGTTFAPTTKRKVRPPWAPSQSYYEWLSRETTTPFYFQYFGQFQRTKEPYVPKMYHSTYEPSSVETTTSPNYERLVYHIKEGSTHFW